jgi:S1-C subfamily serine protease
MSTVVLTSWLVLGWVQSQDGSSRQPDPQAASIVASIETLISDAIARAEPSVVTINRDKNENGKETLAVRGRRRSRVPAMMLPGRGLALENSSSTISLDNGAGVVIGDHGEILTLFHVVRGARELVVRATGKQEFRAEIIAADPRSDLAVIVPAAGDEADPPKLKPIKMGDAGTLRKGAFLIALGNSFNAARDGSASASWGILSNIARRLEFETDEYAPGPQKTLGLMHFPTLLQLDTKLNLGMSGGAVINLKGELVGITTMASSPAGFDALAGYAVPMDRIIRRAIATLKEGKEVEYGFLGLRADNKYSNRVSELTENSPALLGQLRIDDQIIAVNDIPVTDFESLILAVNAFSAGDAIRLKIVRGDQVLERTIVLAKLAVDGEVIASNRPKPWRGLRVEYSSVLYRGSRFTDRPTSGVVVMEVEDGSAAAAAGIKRGQLISGVGGDAVRTPREFADAVARTEGPVILDTDGGQVTVK